MIVYPEFMHSPLSPLSRESLKSPKSPIFNQEKLGQDGALFNDDQYMNEIDNRAFSNLQSFGDQKEDDDEILNT